MTRYGNTNPASLVARIVLKSVQKVEHFRGNVGKMNETDETAKWQGHKGRKAGKAELACL